MFVNKYPYTDFHELNLDWLLGQMLQLRTDMKDFINQNVIKYADPIQWNITTQYEANTVVIEPNSGNAYISSQPVPAGVAISNTDYWSVIGNFSILYESIKESIAAADDGSNIYATEARTEGQLLWLNSKLYKVLSDISVGALYITSGTGQNLQEVTIEELLNSEIEARQADVEVINSSILNMAGQIEQLEVDSLLIYPELYGAVGDGVTDDTAAVQECIDNSSIIVMRNSYRITDTIEIPTGKRIYGGGSVIVDTLESGLSLTGDDISIDNITFSDTGETYTSTSKCIIKGIRELRNIKVTNCVFNDIHHGYCVYLEYSENIDISFNEFNGYSYAGIALIDGCLHATVNHNYVYNGQFTADGANRYPITVSGYFDTFTRIAQYIQCNHNYIRDINKLWEGIDSHGVNNAEFIGNVIYNTSKGIVLTHPTADTSPKLINNSITIKDNNITSDMQGVCITGYGTTYGSADICIENNFITCAGNSELNNTGGAITLYNFVRYYNVVIAHNRVVSSGFVIAFGSGVVGSVNIIGNLLIGSGSGSNRNAVYFGSTEDVLSCNVKDNYMSNMQRDLYSMNTTLGANTHALIEYSNNVDSGNYANTDYTTVPRTAITTATKSKGHVGDFIPNSAGGTVAGWLCVASNTWVAVTSTSA